MIKKLKIKFILTNMILISIVLIAAFGIMYYNTKADLEKNSYEAMLDIIHEDRPKPNHFLEPNIEKESKHSYLSTYVIEFNERTNTYYIDGFGQVDDLSDEELQRVNKLIDAVNAAKSNEGFLEEYNMRFLTERTPFGKKIVLLDKRYEDDNLNQLLISFFIAGTIAFTAFLIISIIVANIAIKPVAESIKQQKQLVSDISHELKTPITVISTNTDIVLSHSESTVNNENKWLGYIKDETKRMSELLNMMLYLAKTDESGNKAPLTTINISDLVLEVSLPFESVCFEKSKEFEIDVDADILIKGDPATIKQLIVILLDNAVKYSNEFGKILLSLYKNNEKAILSVFNTGEPIPKESIPHIFDRFYRVDKARSRDNGGSGLGLSIAKRIIENNEASIGVTSDEKSGTTFTCSFDIFKQKKKTKYIIQ